MDQRIAELIEKLGSDSYASRIRARDQLKSLGLEAFDALRDAQNHDDSEILSAARYLISSLQVSWSKETDPREVQEILTEYGAQNATERLGRIELLGRLRDQQGIEALTRLARFDRKELLNRRAAMLVLKQPMPAEPVRRKRLAEQIESIIGSNTRDSSKWLLAYASDLREGGYSSNRWKALVDEQRRKLDAGLSPNVTSVSVMRLVRVLATRAMDEGASGPALEMVSDHIDLVAPTSRDLAEHAAWSISQSLFPVVVQMYENHQLTFNDNAELLYSAAQSYSAIGDTDQGEQLAKAALGLTPFPETAKDDDEKDPDAPRAEGELTDHQIHEIAMVHYQIALLLRSRGQYDWAEREFREIIDHRSVESTIGVATRQSLALQFSEQLRHQDAVQLLFPIADRAGKDKQYQARMNRLEYGLRQIRSLYHFEHAQAILDVDPSELTPEVLSEVKTNLQLAYQLDDANIDILIRMYRLDDPADPDWKTTVSNQLLQSQNELSKNIARIESRKNVTPLDKYKEEAGESFNQYAWLVANTEGDFERALKYSLDSLDFLDSDEVGARAARLDTCARCYFALGRVEEAIETQELAIKLDPFSPPMLRQLKEFKASL